MLCKLCNNELINVNGTTMVLDCDNKCELFESWSLLNLSSVIMTVFLELGRRFT